MGARSLELHITENKRPYHELNIRLLPLSTLHNLAVAVILLETYGILPVGARDGQGQPHPCAESHPIERVVCGAQRARSGMLWAPIFNRHRGMGGHHHNWGATGFFRL